jgi:hypothetical protein
LQLIGTQPDDTHSPEPLHVCVAEQLPQSSARPQPSPTVPQYFPDESWQASGVQPGPLTQMFDSQTCPFGQAPQSIVLKQPLPIMPQ